MVIFKVYSFLPTFTKNFKTMNTICSTIMTEGQIYMTLVPLCLIVAVTAIYLTAVKNRVR